MTTGKLIVIDGSDGSGKTTQANLLIKQLQKDGFKTAFYDFPQYNKTFFGKMVGRYLSGEFGQADEVSPFLASLLYAGDRFQASKEMCADIEQGKVVICNRYIQSNLGHQSAKFNTNTEKEEYAAWLFDLEYGVYGIPKPDLVIFLHVPYMISQKLTSNADAINRKGYSKGKDIHEANVDFMKRSVAEYCRLSDIYAEWQKIDCYSGENILPITEIQRKVYQIVKKELED
jgi:dTMP kinase